MCSLNTRCVKQGVELVSVSLSEQQVRLEPAAWVDQGCVKVCREASEIGKPGKKSSLSLRSPYILSQIILCAETDVPKCVKPLHKVSPIFYFLIQTTSKGFLESLPGLVCSNDVLYLREKCSLVMLLTGERAIFPEDCYVFRLLFCPEDIVRF